MQKGCVKKIQGSTSDMISCLPGNVIEKILTCMPIHDAVRTSILSRKWRYAWVTLPHLVFDDAFCRESRRTPKDKLMMTIYQVLLLHQGPILKFKLSLSKLESCAEIDQLLLSISNNGIQELILNIWRGGPYKLPSSIFSYLQLKHLKLHDCLFNPPPTFKGFSKLLILELEYVSITSEVFSSLISTCPLLEELNLVICTSCAYLEIIAPNLKCLYFEGGFSSICFKNTPNLARVSINLYDLMNGEEISKWVTLFAGLPVIEFLQLNCCCYKLSPVGGVPKKLPTKLSHLKILKLYTMCMEDANVVSSILCLIRSSPNLEKIAIWACTDEVEVDEPVLKLLEEQGWWDISLNRLREVELQPASSTGFELEFIKVLLATSPALEKMVIEPSSLMDLERYRFLKEVTQFRRLSPLAEVSYESPFDS
ncbi:F-box/FBD/LRR-repeat protein At1g13570-like [Diospyros lotus]|uniref:F-box/FBD/LRR-repeat protein At1g13570-like n=1 Tax=Diospyros lotus TaxID=55363 RepID=UPI002253F730|nr:F-box/FBD/LRR-repeat protein At1g13570-like [Diospyros lotus]XP_052209024.1 F-box/FBD/LRR-repeat protein At1g13570-like [Diospyros lotus]XP_052209025.1 F-box/FBD/LRR-repeat protein At1g13570-like [Diospyros lotus]XP_052209026.1 F-box/FBD/LRR-repeat protein At1g13570-like [Diospyros lotus]XP_052209027.1 F-box/FBD/LRR-repeat protein At1g13570-like [Diospyros lotus]XP_052209028.1 F-box/FBD/LRR-repeat protein At1g13570-like [Diospyros lotus]XP_052209029.1 F-box/FBD/LRR-repeat protein At1g13570